MTEGTALTGDVTVTVRLDGAATALTCTVPTAGGDCAETTSFVSVTNGDKLAIEVDSSLNAGAWTFTYSLVFD